MRTGQCVAVVATAVALAATPAAASTAPAGQGLESVPATCNGQPATIVAGSGAALWLGDQRYVLTSFHGSFVPAGGGETESYIRAYGERSGLTGEPVDCSGSVTSAGGVFSFDATAVPVVP